MPIAVAGEGLILNMLNAASLPWLVSTILSAVLPGTLIAYFLLGSDN
jgi:hypothetical protein